MFWRGYGRINRPTYFAGLGIVVLVWAAAIGFEVKIPGEAIALLVAIPRLHDIGRSGWWAGAVLLAELIVVLGGLDRQIALLHQHARRVEKALMLGDLAVLHRPADGDVGLDVFAAGPVQRLGLEQAPDLVVPGGQGLGREAHEVITRE